MRRFRITRDGEQVHAGDLKVSVPDAVQLLKDGHYGVRAGDRLTFVESQPSGSQLFTHMSVHEDKVRGGLRVRMEFTSLKTKEQLDAEAHR